ncbi:MAG: carbohydrate-binding protein, partial [Hymenobacter sp.]|nr:carbohydrate-binding protein [Hymenobacter sp.]
YRVASPNGGTLSSDLNGGRTQLGSMAIQATGGWQTWRTMSQTVNVTAGTYSFGINARTGGWNINWLRISKVGAASTTLASKASAASEQAVSLYPNPVADRLRLAAPPELLGRPYQILDVLGRVKRRGIVSSQEVDVAELRAGVYTLHIEKKESSRIIRQFIKQ